MAYFHEGQPSADWIDAYMNGLSLMLEAIISQAQPGRRRRATLLMRFARQEISDALAYAIAAQSED